MVLLLLSRQKPHEIKKSTQVRLCSFLKMKKPLQAPSESRENCFKITLWTSSGFSEVVVVIARENMCN